MSALHTYESDGSGRSGMADGARDGKRKERSSNLELYRIIAMLLIVAHHYVVNSGLAAAGGPIYRDPTAGRSVYLLLMGAWGKTGINCFVLITGYFMCRSSITAKKFFRLLFEILFYRIGIWLVFVFAGRVTFRWSSLWRQFIPVRTIEVNFSSCYLVFFLFIPFLNILVQNMTEIQHRMLILLCAFLYVFLGTVPGFSVTMNYVSWFMVLYVIGSYIGLHPSSVFGRTKLWGFMTLLFIALCAASVIAGAYASAATGERRAYSYVTDANTFLALMLGISSFLFFKNLKIRQSRLINLTASSTFGVLLIHAGSGVMRTWLWGDLLGNLKAYSSPYLPLHAIGSVLGIFAVCVVIDQLRMKLIEGPFFKLWDRVSGQGKFGGKELQ